MAVLRFLFYAAFSCLIIFAGNAGAVEKYSEYQVKATFLYNFISFVEWPQSTENRGSITVCTFGETPVFSNLAAFDGDKVRGKTVEIERIKTINEADKCDVLFLAVSERDKARKLLSHIKNLPVLSVSDIPGFVESGGIIQFVEEGSKVRFKINLNAAKDAGLKISSRLLKIAYIVGEK